ncbi:hypothetical protein DP129_11470 [Clostridium tetani]|uniref:FtsW/RodA/SpoVE family cell cycle protein n=1 Tax=Clostridium tetani TaxID=1513 RepID=UPI00100A6600|nr:FtsW/RodA/SpoVE family cell cycle protein [Clostridium tetani]RXI37965.1 hypothetical protein DP129_11470 [Clostridium tetani]
MGIKDNCKVKNYIDEILSEVKNKEVHEEIREEILDHIEDSYEGYIEDGLEKEKAIIKAIENMGEPLDVGYKLNAIHKGKPEWTIIVLSLFFSILGIGFIYFMGISGDITRYSYYNMMAKSIVALVFGITLSILLYKFDYRKIKKYSYKMFWILNGIVVLNYSIFGSQINGRVLMNLGIANIQFFNIYLILLIISIIGLIEENKHNMVKLVITHFIPIFLMMLYRNTVYALIYSIVFIFILFKCKLHKVCVLFSAVFLLIMGIVIERNPYMYSRMAGYIYFNLKEILSKIKPIGKGFEGINEVLPLGHSEFILAYIITSIGWIMGAILVLTIGYFIIKLMKSSKIIKDNYGKLIVESLTLVLSIEFVLGILMNLSLFPVMGITIPFISYGGSALFTNIISIGIIMSVYKRKSYSPIGAKE